MKYKVLLLLFLFIAYSRVLKRLKTKQGESKKKTLKVELPNDSESKPYYIFYTDDFFEKHNVFEENTHGYNTARVQLGGFNDDVADLLMCIYDLKMMKKLCSKFPS
jgi:hypothetical protein